MADKLTAEQEAQARIVAEQEDAQSVPPYPSPAQIDAARLSGVAVETADDTKAEKSDTAKKPGAGYSTRAVKAD